MKYPDLTKHLTTPSENNSLLTELLLVEYFCSPSPIGTQGSFGFGLYEYKPVALQYYVLCGYMMEKGSLDALQQDVFIYLVWKEKKWNTSWFLFFYMCSQEFKCLSIPTLAFCFQSPRLEEVIELLIIVMLIMVSLI